MAHNPNTTSLVLSPVNGVWLAQFIISQEGANVALSEFYKDQDLQNKTLDEYKILYIDYLKSHAKLLVDGEKIAFSSAGIKLGNHQTNINFLLPDFPNTFEEVQLSLPLFEENVSQNTVVKFEYKGKSVKKVLNHQNLFYLEFHQTDTDFVLHTSPSGRNYKTIAFISVSLLTLVLLIGFIIKKSGA